MGRLVGRRFGGRVGSGIYVVKRISFWKACCIVSRRKEDPPPPHNRVGSSGIGVVILGFVEKIIKRWY